MRYDDFLIDALLFTATGLAFWKAVELVIWFSAHMNML